MKKIHFLTILLISILLSFSLQFSLPVLCLAQSSDKAKVDALYQKYQHFKKQGSYKEALKYAKELVPAGEKAFGRDHRNVATFLNELALLYDSLGDYAKAEPLYGRSLSIYEKALGPDHPRVANSLNNLAGLYASLDDFQKAHLLHKKAQQIDGKLIDQVMGFTTEDRKMKFLSMKSGDLYAFMSLVDQYLSSNPPAKKDVLDVWLKRRE